MSGRSGGGLSGSWGVDLWVRREGLVWADTDTYLSVVDGASGRLGGRLGGRRSGSWGVDLWVRREGLVWADTDTYLSVVDGASGRLGGRRSVFLRRGRRGG
jgi:hypothetical protein